MKLAFVLLLGFLATVATLGRVAAADPVSTVAVTGKGATLDDAKTDAIRRALQLTMKQLVVVDRAIENDRIIRDRVISTMDGFVERFVARRMRRTDGAFEIDAEVTVSPSRIENFIALATGGSGEFEGSAIAAEQHRRLAQNRAEQLQAKARGEIFDRTLRGYPSEVMQMAATRIGLSEADPNVLKVDLRLQYGKRFQRALIGTLESLSTHRCHFDKPDSNQIHKWCRRQHRNVGSRSHDIRPVACLRTARGADCYILRPGDYCSSCLLKRLQTRIAVLGRLVTSKGATVSAEKCWKSWFSAARTWTTVPGRLSIRTPVRTSGDSFALDLDFRPIEGFVHLDAAKVDLAKAKYFVAVAALGPSTRTPNADLLVDLAPWQGYSEQDGCALLEEATQRHMLEAQ